MLKKRLFNDTNNHLFPEKPTTLPLFTFCYFLVTFWVMGIVKPFTCIKLHICRCWFVQKTPEPHTLERAQELSKTNNHEGILEITISAKI
jgi:hypothetical protein